jgi:hypothetical protein
MEEEIGHDIGMDTYMLESYDISYAQRKRTQEQESGSRKKEKAHMKTLETSLTVDDVELIVMEVEDQFSEVWDNAENHRASIMEQI